MNLRPYQIEGKRDIFNAWNAGHRILMYVCATGGGKTVTFVEVIREFLLETKCTMLIAHRDELIQQSFETLYRERIYSGIIKGSTKTDYSLPSQVCSIGTIARRPNLPEVDLIVIDEGHHVTDDNSYAKILQRFPNARVLIVTATPYRLSGDGFKHIIKGEETHLIINATLKQLIEDAWLVPIRYFLASIPDMSNVSVSKGDYVEEQAYDAMKLAPIVESYMEHANGLQGICFAVNVAHSLDIVKQYLAAGIDAVHLDSNTPDDDYAEKDTGIVRPGRRNIVQMFRDGLIKIVSNVGIFTEGTDFPNCQFVQLARPTKSLSMYLQMVGRATRAEAGLVDKYDSQEMRAFAIACSSKPHAKILDNAGLWLEHGLPDAEIDWQLHFEGRKSKKKKLPVGDMEMLVWEAEDSDGKRIKTFNAHEVVGMRLIEVTKAVRSKVANIKSISEFDKIYAQLKRVPQCSKPGYVAYTNYVAHCAKNNILMVPEIWTYLYEKLVNEIDQQLHRIEQNHSQGLHMMPPDLLAKSQARIKACGVSRRWLIIEQDKYTRANSVALLEYNYSKEQHSA